jgi:hypothetical protein
MRSRELMRTVIFGLCIACIVVMACDSGTDTPDQGLPATEEGDEFVLDVDDAPKLSDFKAETNDDWEACLLLSNADLPGTEGYVECSGCRCDKCFDEVVGCFEDTGCRTILTCMTTELCLNNPTGCLACADVIMAFGGPSGASSMNANAMQSCQLSQCADICDYSLGPDGSE